DEPSSDRVQDLNKYDRLDGSSLAYREEIGVGLRNDKIRIGLNCFFRVDTNPLGITVGEAIIDLDVAPHGPAEHLQSLVQGYRTGLRFGVIRNSHQHDNPAHADLLRVRRERPCCCRAAEQRHELPPLHVWMAPAWQEKMQRAAQKSLAVMCPACSRSPDGLLALMESANRG